MTAPQEQLIIDQIAAWLSEISIDSGYHSDAGASVAVEEFRQRDTTVPLLTVIDTDYSTTEPRKWRMSVDVEGVFLRSETERVQARLLLNDIARALFRRSGHWREIGAGVTAVQPQARQIGRAGDTQSGGGDYQRVVYSLVVEYSDLSDAPAA